MKLAKGFLLVFIGLAIMITLFSLLIPSRVMTVRTVMIHASPEKVFEQIADLKNWKHWHPVFMQDSNLVQVSSPSSGVNAYAEWSTTGKKNKLLITGVEANKLNLLLERPGENSSNNIISVTAMPDSNAVQAEWRVLTKLKWYPWEKFSGFFVEKITGAGYEAALNNLRTFVEGE